VIRDSTAARVAGPVRRGVLFLLASLALGGCGGSGASVADCLNAKSFLVEESANVIRGSSAHGVNFTLRVYAQAAAARRAFGEAHRPSSALLGDAVVDFSGNPPGSPGGAPRTLSRGDLATIRACLSHP